MKREQVIDLILSFTRDVQSDTRCACPDCGPASAGKILDAILPQVTTVEELEALPEGAKVIGTDGSAWEFCPFTDGWAWMGTNTDAWGTRDLLANFGPLTIVWQP